MGLINQMLFLVIYDLKYNELVKFISRLSGYLTVIGIYVAIDSSVAIFGSNRAS